MFRVSDAWDIIAGAFLLIFVYLLLVHGREVSRLISAIGGQSKELAETLQGR